LLAQLPPCNHLRCHGQLPKGMRQRPAQEGAKCQREHDHADRVTDNDRSTIASWLAPIAPLTTHDRFHTGPAAGRLIVLRERRQECLPSLVDHKLIGCVLGAQPHTERDQRLEAELTPGWKV
jgi:hypothetical protein